MKKIAVYGAGGFGKEVRGMIERRSDCLFAGFFDDYKDIGPAIDNDSYEDALIAIADPQVRERIANNWSRKAVNFESLISSEIVLHPTVRIDKGAIVCDGVRITVDVCIGQFTIINLNSTVGHDARIGDFCSIMPAVNISGNVRIGNSVFIGTGSIILPGISIGDNAVVGAGSVVTRNVSPNETVFGIPARRRIK